MIRNEKGVLQMAKSKAEKTPRNYENLVREIKKSNRDEVLRILKSKEVDMASLENADEVYAQLVGLRDLRIVNCLASQMGHFPRSMLQIDLDNGRNRDFVNQVLSKYCKKFKLSDSQTAKELFALALKIGNVKIPNVIMKKKATPEMFVALASSSMTTFELLQQVRTSSFDANTIVEILYAAALCDNGQERLKALIKSHYSVTITNEEGNTVEDLLAKQVQSNNYPANKKGNQKKLADKNTLQYLHRYINGGMDAEKAKKKKITIGCAIAGIVAIVVVAGCILWYQKDKASDSTETSETSTESDAADSSEADSTGTTLNTDTSLTVADGDTINLDYVGYVDGIAFEGGDTEGNGTSLTIGSGSYIDDFETQLIGHNVGEEVDVVVTFPDVYQNNPDLAGKEATFKCTINGIYQ